MISDAISTARPRPNAIAWRPRKLEKMVDRYRYRSWFDGKEFSSDWTSGNFTMWRRVLSPLRDEPLRILEIGSWEGRSALFFLKFFERSTIVCIDTFEGTPEEAAVYEALGSMMRGVEDRFDRNLAAFGPRVEKRKGRSDAALAQLKQEQRRFDLAYIDGGHRYDQVLADSLGVWQMVEPGGVIIWDDYEWGDSARPEEQVRPAVDAFLRDHKNEHRLLAKTYQIAIERLP
jgi:predicted O-methyltransferase YrrM